MSEQNWHCTIGNHFNCKGTTWVPSLSGDRSLATAFVMGFKRAKKKEKHEQRT